MLYEVITRSGATKATVIIEIEEATEVNQTLAAKIVEKQEMLEKDELSFKQSVITSYSIHYTKLYEIYVISRYKFHSSINNYIRKIIIV